MLRHIAIVSLLLSAPALAQERTGLKPGPGKDAVTTTCAICHSLDYLQMNSVFLTSDGWKATVVKMRDAFGAPIDDDTAATIIKYLTSTYGVPPKS